MDIVPELFDERLWLLSERASLAVGYPAYVCARALIETPRAISEVWSLVVIRLNIVSQSTILLVIGYLMVELNTDPTIVLFNFTVLYLGKRNYRFKSLVASKASCRGSQCKRSSRSGTKQYLTNADMA